MSADYEKIASFEALLEGHRRARRGKGKKKDTILFEMNLARYLWWIKQRLDNHSYDVSGYNLFKVFEPKERDIQALQYHDRIVQHSLCDNVLMPCMERRLIVDNCACRKNKGTYYGIRRLSRHLSNYYRQHGNKGWFLKVDIRKYFASINHEVLKSRLSKERLQPDILELLFKIIDSYNGNTGIGLPMGNQTSQLFALYYLDPVDRFVKEKARIKYYSRYMDDMILLHESKEYLQQVLAAMRDIASNLKLEFNSKTQLIPIKNGIDYLGWHFALTESGKVVRKIRAMGKKRMYRKVKQLCYQYSKGLIDLEQVKQVMASLFGHMRLGHTWSLQRRICSKLKLVRRDVTGGGQKGTNK